MGGSAPIEARSVAVLRHARILFDARMAFQSGIGSYVRGLTDVIGSRLEDGVFHPVGKPVSDSGGLAPRPPIYSLREQLWYVRLARRNRDALFHVPHYNAPLWWPGPLVVTVHDLAHLRCPDAARRRGARWYAMAMLRHVARRADAVICVSQYTRNDLLAFAPQLERKVRVIHNGVDPSLGPVPERERDAVLARYGLRPGYLLYLGNVRPHKNVDQLIRAYRRLDPPRPPLVLAGADQMPSGWPGRREAGLRLLGAVAAGDRAALYAGASVFCFPSRFEGFGLPPLEAMRCGVAVVCSNAASLPEVVGDAAVLVPPDDVEALARDMGRLLRDRPYARRLVERGRQRAQAFLWRRAADATLATYRCARQRWCRRRQPQRAGGASGAPQGAHPSDDPA